MRLLQSVRTALGRIRFLRVLRLLIQRTHVPAATMRFPTFDARTHEFAVQKADYFRFATIALALRRILSDGIAGSMAEVGVYQGNMSGFVHQIAPERRYYLFDTFEGFPARDLDVEASGDARFRDTSVDRVLRNIGDTRNIIVRKGYVPDTLNGLEGELFAFVLLDLDLYNPTLSSLGFFYPRLVRGGYLVVHDYNSPESRQACKRAFDEFMSDKAERIIEIADEWGTAMIRKV